MKTLKHPKTLDGRVYNRKRADIINPSKSRKSCPELDSNQHILANAAT